MNQSEHKVILGSTADELSSKIQLARKCRATPIPDQEFLDNIGLYLTRQNLARISFIRSLYEKILPVHGVIMEFGVRWGQNMSLFSTYRAMLEPYNYNRKIIGFDTFTGFPSVDRSDGDLIVAGDYSTTPGWRDELESILSFHEKNAPIPQKKKFELVEGDASLTMGEYLKSHPETIISLAYFDFDIYTPTKDCLQAILPHLTRGSVLAFDELNCPEFPGETLALREVLGLDRYKIQRDPLNPLTSFLIID